MSITERTLRKWRKEALTAKNRIVSREAIDGGEETKVEWAKRILKMTQELLDLHLLGKK